MILPVVKYGHPVLRQKGADIKEITRDILKLVDDMLETMYDANGVGLAAQQVAQALRLTVIDVTDIPDRPSWMEVNGARVNLEDYMPLVLMNPVITPVGTPVPGPEGCLSFPEMFGEITRPESVDVSALTPSGKVINFRCGGLLSRAVQHENDHLNGILFIDRMDKKTKLSLQDELDILNATTKESLKKK